MSRASREKSKARSTSNSRTRAMSSSSRGRLWREAPEIPAILHHEVLKHSPSLPLGEAPALGDLIPGGARAQALAVLRLVRGRCPAHRLVILDAPPE